MADSCGYEVFVENSFKSNSIFSKYLASGDDWIIEGVYLATISQPNGSIKLALKMDPTQFNNPDTEDCLLVGSNVDMELQRGDVVRAYGGWYGR